MKELLEVADAWAEIDRRGEKAALATVVRVDGSAYRRPGARMLVGPKGRVVGMVSGGCLEADVAERARRVIETGRPEVLVYDSSADSDRLYGYGLGCGGAIHILIEPVHSGDPAGLDVLAALVRSRQKAVVATVIGDFPAEAVAVRRPILGNRFIVTDAEAVPTVPANFSAARADRESLLEQALGTLAREQSVSVECDFEGCRVPVFFEYLPQAVSLVVFGAGANCEPLVRSSVQLGWRVRVVDHRPAFADPANFPGVHPGDVILSDRESLPAALTLTADDYAVVIHHELSRDRIALARLLASPVRYIGILGHARRTRDLLHDLRTEWGLNGDLDLTRVHGPIGLDIGASTPDEIAIAIIAEILAVKTGRPGGKLRNRHL